VRSRPSRSLVGKMAGTGWADLVLVEALQSNYYAVRPRRRGDQRDRGWLQASTISKSRPTQRHQVQHNLRARPHAVNSCRHRHRFRRARNRSICSSDVPVGRVRGQTNPRDCRIARILRSFVHVQGPFMVACPGGREDDGPEPGASGPRTGKPEGAPSRGKRGSPDASRGSECNRSRSANRNAPELVRPQRAWR
jgi:hypothetical protein